MSHLAIHGGEPTITKPWPQWPVWDEREVEAVREVMESGVWGGTMLGPKVTALNERFARYCDARYGVALCNGTITMELALRGLGIGPGDEVIVPAYTFMATAIVVAQVGATPVFVDVDRDTLCLNPDRTEAAVSERTKAMIPVHLGGHPCDMERLLSIARRHDLRIVEDAAQAHGALWNGRKLGALGDAGSYSFQQSKNMQCGEGGIVVTDDPELADLIHYSLGKFGRGLRDDYAFHRHYRLAGNASITEIQAAIALVQLERLEEQTQRRAANGRALIERLDDVEGVEPLRWAPYCTRHGYHLFFVRYRAEALDYLPIERFVEALNAEGVPASTLYPVPLFRQPMYDLDRMNIVGTNIPIRTTSCPEAERACREMVVLPQHVLLAEREDMEGISEAVGKIYEGRGLLR